MVPRMIIIPGVTSGLGKSRKPDTTNNAKGLRLLYDSDKIGDDSTDTGKRGLTAQYFPLGSRCRPGFRRGCGVF